MGKKSKFLKTLTIFGTALAAPLLLTGCFGGSENKTDFRVYNGYIQTTTDGTNWENLIALEDIKGEDGTDGLLYTIGADGYWYLNGIKTNNKAIGTDGDAGSKITSITKDTTNSTAEKTIYIIELEDGTKYPFEVLNGTDGKDGTDADVWTIEADGYWYKNSVKTDKKAIGTDGSNGEDGKDADIWTIGINGNWYKNGADTGNKAVGEDGEDGNGIKAITKDTTNSTAEKTIYIIELEDGTKYPFEVVNGTNGKDGTDGITPTISISDDGYWIINGSKTDKKAIGTDGSKGEDGKDADVWTIGADGYWYKNGNVTEYKAIGQDTTYSTYTVTYDYGILSDFFKTTKSSDTIKSNEWLTTLPEIKDENKDSFLGWFIQGTDKEVSNYDFVGGNVTLDARFDVEKLGYSGLYQKGKYVMSWEDIKEEYSNAFSGISITHKGYSSYFKDLEGQLIIDDEIMFISEYAFSNCKFTKIKLPQNLKTIGEAAFQGCNNLTNITIPETVQTIDAGAFHHCDNIQKIYYNAVNAADIESTYNYKGIFEGIGSVSKNVIVFIGNKVEYIPKNLLQQSFTYETYINEVIFEENSICKTIGEFAFEHCDGLTNVVIPSSVETISSGAFSQCQNLNTVTILSSNVNIEENAFNNYSNKLLTIILDNETIANSLTSSDVYGNLILYATKIYVRQELDTQNSTYLTENYEKQKISDKIGYNLWMKKV